MVEHKPWVGSDYENGVNGQKIAVIGFSSYSENVDYENFTIDLIQSCVSGPTEDFDGDLASFNAVPRYFGFPDKKEFWPKVMFFNFLPGIVGGPSQKFEGGSPEQLSGGATRVPRLLAKYKPSKAFVFST